MAALSITQTETTKMSATNGGDVVLLPAINEDHSNRSSSAPNLMVMSEVGYETQVKQ
jgi:hypothetical protein